MKTHPTLFALLLTLFCCSCGKPQVVSAQTPVKPRAHEEILKLVDFSSFPKMEGATRQSSDVLNASFTVPIKDDSTVKSAVKVMETFLVSQGWAVESGSWGADGGVVFYKKDGVMIEATAGVTRSFQGGSDLNAGLFLTGEVDARLLPRPPDSKVEQSDFASCRYHTPADVLAVHKFNKEQLGALGWGLYRDSSFAGLDLTQEQLQETQSFVQNGATLAFRFTRNDAGTEVSVRSGLLTSALPIMPGSDLLKLRDGPPLVSYFVKGTAAEVLAWHTDALGKLGWSGKEVPATEEHTTRHEFQKTGSKPLYLVCLPSKDQTVVQLRE